VRGTSVTLVRGAVRGPPLTTTTVVVKMLWAGSARGPTADDFPASLLDWLRALFDLHAAPRNFADGDVRLRNGVWTGAGVCAMDNEGSAS
jgi:hypothetical protein